LIFLAIRNIGEEEVIMKTLYGIDIGLPTGGTEVYYLVETKEMAEEIIKDYEELNITAFSYPLDISTKENIDIEICYSVTILKDALIKNLEIFPEAYHTPENYGLNFNVDDKKNDEQHIMFYYRTSLDDVMRHRSVIIGEIEDLVNKVFKDADFEKFVSFTEREMVEYILPFYKEVKK
jgi:hypothetical protein